MTTIYLNRDNKIRLRLQYDDGSTVEQNTITRAVLRLTGGPDDIVFDTQGDVDATLTDSATVLQVAGGSRSIPARNYTGLLTLYDADSQNGLAWDRISVKAKPWPATEGQ